MILKELWKLLMAVLIGFVLLNLVLGLTDAVGFPSLRNFIYRPFETIKGLAQPASG